jgi:hypothetical protein
MTDTLAQHEEVRVAPYDAIVDAYNLTILQDVGDWSLENGDLAMTKDGDIKVGDAAYNGLFRLVQIWRFSEAHLQYLFATMNKMLAWRERLDDNMNALGEEKLARFNPERSFGPDPDFSAAFNDIRDQQATATFGAGIYAGSLMLMLSGALLRLKDDIDTKDDWTKVGPFFNNHSVGRIVEAGANDFRHADEWTKTRVPTSRQKRSQEIIEGALIGRPTPDEGSPGRCVELLQLLSRGDFEGLASNVFTFAHNLAIKVRQAS